MINDYHILALGLATKDELGTVSEYAFKINDILKSHFLKLNIQLVDFKLEFGKTTDGDIVLADEISPDTCRFWDVSTGEKLDKDRFRRDLGGESEAYREVFRRLTGQSL
jgi:phosphoribosylaminoimidazole-succinocarboxamide synthase